MQTLAFDGRMGASGDMILGALLDIGADPGALDPIQSDVDVTITHEEATSAGIAGTDVTVRLPDSRAEGHGPHRAYSEVVAIIETLAVPESAIERALAAVRLLGEAEAAVHGTDLESVHFHEVGADDAIADIVGAALLLEDLGPDRIVTGPLVTGTGEVETSHGVYPIPPPAVVEIAGRAGIELRPGSVTGELLTPTGAAILGAMAEPLERQPGMTPDAVGYGLGDRSYENRPNVLRAIRGRTSEGLEREPIAVLETHLDDATPEVLGHLQERLPEAGAHDVAITPLTMKKSRPGHRVTVITDPANEASVARILAEETGTLGVRATLATHRWIAARRFETATIEIDGSSYELPVKVATDTAGTVVDISPEFDDAAAIAAQTDHPVRTILERARRALE